MVSNENYLVLVNKEQGLPDGYAPDDLTPAGILFTDLENPSKRLLRHTAARALENLVVHAARESIFLKGVSGYRSYQRQKEIYTNNIETHGLEYTLQYSAAPGYSEHQTGLAMDLSSQSAEWELSEIFAYTPEGRWLAENAHLFGFIIRYPAGKTDITGYAYEPWHIRYIGLPSAHYIYTHQITLEEFLNVRF